LTVVLFVFLFAKRPGTALGPMCHLTDIPKMKRISKCHLVYSCGIMTSCWCHNVLYKYKSLLILCKTFII